MTYVLDACALVALINREEGAETVDNLFQQAVKGIATAVELDGAFVTSDHHELEAIAAKETAIKFFWFR